MSAPALVSVLFLAAGSATCMDSSQPIAGDAGTVAASPMPNARQARAAR